MFGLLFGIVCVCGGGGVLCVYVCMCVCFESMQRYGTHMGTQHDTPRGLFVCLLYLLLVGGGFGVLGPGPAFVW